MKTSEIKDMNHSQLAHLLKVLGKCESADQVIINKIKSRRVFVASNSQLQENDLALISLVPDICLQKIKEFYEGHNWSYLSTQAIVHACIKANRQSLDYADLCRAIKDNQFYISNLKAWQVEHILSSSKFNDLSVFNFHLSGHAFPINDLRICERIIDQFKRLYYDADDKKRRASKPGKFFRYIVCNDPLHAIHEFGEDFMDAFKFDSKDISSMVATGIIQQKINEWIIKKDAPKSEEIQLVMDTLEQMNLQLIEDRLGSDKSSSRASSANAELSEMIRKLEFTMRINS